LDSWQLVGLVGCYVKASTVVAIVVVVVVTLIAVVDVVVVADLLGIVVVVAIFLHVHLKLWKGNFGEMFVQKKQ